MFPPNVVVCPGVDQLNRDSHAIGCGLHGSFQDVRDAKLLSNFANVTLKSGLILIDRRPTDDFKVGDFGQVGQNFILNAFGQMEILVLAQIFERKNGNTLRGNDDVRRCNRVTGTREFRNAQEKRRCRENQSGEQSPFRPAGRRD